MNLFLSVNVHGIGPEAAATAETELFGRDAHGRYTYRIGLERLLDALSGDDLKATFFWPVFEATRLPGLLERCVVDGHEIANHGRAFEDHARLGEREAEVLEEAHTTLSRLAGTPPVGFRSATGTLSEQTVPILDRLGYTYDSSFLDDDEPYSLSGDGGDGMVELPWSEGLTDATHFRRRATQDRAEAHLTEELDGLLDAAGYACLTVHPRADIGIGRAARLPILSRIVARARSRGAAPTLGRDLAASVRAATQPAGGRQ